MNPCNGLQLRQQKFTPPFAPFAPIPGKRFFAASLAVHRKSCVLELKRQVTLKEAKVAFEARQKAAKAAASTAAAKVASPTDEPLAALGGDGVSPRFDPEPMTGLPGPDGRLPCKVCGRHFDPTRVGAHSAICARLRQARAGQAPLRVYDSSVARRQGVEAPGAAVAYLFGLSMAQRARALAGGGKPRGAGQSGGGDGGSEDDDDGDDGHVACWDGGKAMRAGRRRSAATSGPGSCSGCGPREERQRGPGRRAVSGGPSRGGVVAGAVAVAAMAALDGVLGFVQARRRPRALCGVPSSSSAVKAVRAAAAAAAEAEVA